MAPKITQTDLPFRVFARSGLRLSIGATSRFYRRYFSFEGGIFLSPSLRKRPLGPDHPRRGHFFGRQTVASRAHRTAVSRLFGTKLTARHSPFIFGVGIPDIGSTDSVRAASRRHSGRLCRSQALPVNPIQFPREQGERAMPMLFWLPMIFVSASWEKKGLPPRA